MIPCGAQTIRLFVSFSTTYIANHNHEKEKLTHQLVGGLRHPMKQSQQYSKSNQRVLENNNTPQTKKEEFITWFMLAIYSSRTMSPYWS